MSNVNDLQSVIDRRRAEAEREKSGFKGTNQILRAMDEPPAARVILNAELVEIWERAIKLRDGVSPKEREVLIAQLVERDVFDLIIMVGRERTKNRMLAADIEHLRAAWPQKL